LKCSEISHSNLCQINFTVNDNLTENNSHINSIQTSNNTESKEDSNKQLLKNRKAKIKLEKEAIEKEDSGRKSREPSQ
jgi:hypothetical protein